METEGSAQGTVTLTAPPNTESGTDVTLTIEAEDPESSDSNYVALRFTVMTKVAVMKVARVDIINNYHQFDFCCIFFVL